MEKQKPSTVQDDLIEELHAHRDPEMGYFLRMALRGEDVVVEVTDRQQGYLIFDRLTQIIEATPTANWVVQRGCLRIVPRTIPGYVPTFGSFRIRQRWA